MKQPPALGKLTWTLLFASIAGDWLLTRSGESGAFSAALWLALAGALF